MTHSRYVYNIERQSRRAMQKYFKRMRAYEPESEWIPDAALLDHQKRLRDDDFPYSEGDRVQILKGEHKGKVGQVIMRYPKFGNAVYVAGAGGKKVVQAIEQRRGDNDESWSPIRTPLSVYDIKDIRLVTMVKKADGVDEDVAIHSLALGPKEYDPLSNSWVRTRFAKYDENILVPFRTKAVEASESPRVTAPEEVEARTHYVTSAIEPSVTVVVAKDILAMHSRQYRERFSRAITEEDLESIKAPSMPVVPQTKELLRKLAEMPKPAKVEFTPEIAEFIGKAAREGLKKRVGEETAALSQYK